MRSYIGKKLKDVIEILPKDNVDYELNYISYTNEAFGDLRIVSEKYENDKWFFVVTFENYQERSVKNARNTKRKTS